MKEEKRTEGYTKAAIAIGLGLLLIGAGAGGWALGLFTIESLIGCGVFGGFYIGIGIFETAATVVKSMFYNQESSLATEASTIPIGNMSSYATLARNHAIDISRQREIYEELHQGNRKMAERQKDSSKLFASMKSAEMKDMPSQPSLRRG